MNLADLFQVVPLTEAINRLPVPPGTLARLNLVREKGIRTTSVAIELRQGRLVLVPNISRNAEPAPYGASKRGLVTLSATHLPLSAVVLPDEIQDVRAFGTDAIESGLQSQAAVINDKLAELKLSLEATRAWHQIGALRGKVLDADGSVIVDLFDVFGVTKKASNIAFTTATTDVRKAILDAKRYAEKKLAGVAVSGFKALCGADWFDALSGHATVKEAYANWQAAQDRLGGDMRGGFNYAGVEFIEIPDSVGATQFIPADRAIVFPQTAGLIEVLNAPANYNEAANTIGQAYYAKAEERRMGKGWDIEAQTNPLTYCPIPEAVVELTAT